MNLQLIIAVLLTLVPLVELRGGLPVAVHYALSNNLPVWPVFLSILFLNILLIFGVFFFLDHLNNFFLRFKIYQKFFNFFLVRARKKAEKLEKQMTVLGFFALALFVAVPLPLTGAYTGCLVAWILGLERKKSIFAISIGVIIAAILILLASFGVFKLV